MDKWIQRFKCKFTELAGDSISVNYDDLAKDCLNKWGLESTPEEAATEEASYYSA